MCFDELMVSLGRLDHLTEEYLRFRRMGMRSLAAYTAARVALATFYRGVWVDHASICKCLFDSSDDSLRGILAVLD